MCYFKKQYWQKHTTKTFPKIILICPNEMEKQKIYGFVKKKINEDSPFFYLSINEEIEKNGINKNTLKKIEWR